MNGSKALASYFENMSLFVIGLLLLAFPLMFLTITTDAFTLPKQIALVLATTLVFIFFVLKMVTEGKLTFRSSPFDLPLLLFILVLFLSAVFSMNRFDGLIGFTPYLFIVFFYFAMVNIIKSKKQLLFALSCLVLGAVAASILTIFSFFNIYLLPLEATHTQAFTPFGSMLDQALYLALVLPIAGQFVYSNWASHQRARKQALSPFDGALQPSHLPKQTMGSIIFFGISFFILLAGFGISLYFLFTTQKPIILPLATGLQTAFAAISQDTSNVFKSLLLGSGVGTYLTDFTRFKTAAFNANPELWAFTFFRSSSYVLELIATVGLLGIAAFIFLIFRIFNERAFFLPLLLAILASFLLPLSFSLIFLFFVLLAIFAVDRIASSNKEKISEIELYFVAFKKRFFHTEATPTTDSQKKHGRFLSILVSLVLLAIIGVPVYYTARYFVSDLVFQRALIAASQNEGLKTYDLEVEAIKLFPYRDVYYRAFSQTNLALASLLVQQNQGDKMNEEIQQNILTLIQQSINGGRTATTIAPLTAFNWNNLSSIYRALIGFGENADRFTLVTSQQAIALDPNNPQQYIDYGGIFYQLGNYDEAIRQFQFAISLKGDYANAYYNLGHALELKGNNEQAIQAYKIVRQLVANDATNVQKIDAEIAALEAKTGTEATQQPVNQQANEQQEPISVNEPTTQLPERDPQAEIPAPTISPVIPTPTRTITPTPIP